MSTALNGSSEASGFSLPIRASLTPAMSVEQARRYHADLQQFIAVVLVEGEDYGELGDHRPTRSNERARKVLLKPGAEKLVHFFGLESASALAEKEYDWTGANHGDEPFFYARYKVKFSKDGIVWGEGEGSCNSWEKKYRWRNQERRCPVCSSTAIMTSKPPRSGYYCFSKKGGCGAEFKVGDPSIEEQTLGKVANPDFGDLVNTIEKMAWKRAYVAAALSATGTSNRFSQDMDDMVVAREPEPQEAPARSDSTAKPKQDTPAKPKQDAPAPQRTAPTADPKPPAKVDNKAPEEREAAVLESFSHFQTTLGRDNYHRLLQMLGCDDLKKTPPDQARALYKTMASFCHAVEQIRAMAAILGEELYGRALYKHGMSDPADADGYADLVALKKDLDGMVTQ